MKAGECQSLSIGCKWIPNGAHRMHYYSGHEVCATMAGGVAWSKNIWPRLHTTVFLLVGASIIVATPRRTMINDSAPSKTMVIRTSESGNKMHEHGTLSHYLHVLHRALLYIFYSSVFVLPPCPVHASAYPRSFRLPIYPVWCSASNNLPGEN